MLTFVRSSDVDHITDCQDSPGKFKKKNIYDFSLDFPLFPPEILSQYLFSICILKVSIWLRYITQRLSLAIFEMLDLVQIFPRCLKISGQLASLNTSINMGY